MAMLLGACGGPSNPSAATPTPSALKSESPSPTLSPFPVCPNPNGGGACLGKLVAGTYTTVGFHPQITYQVPAGWSNFEDLPGNFLLIPPRGRLSGVDPGTSDFIGIYAHITAEPPKCSGPASNVAETPAAIAAFISRQHGLVVTKAKPVSVGGLNGLLIDVSLAKGSKGSKGGCVIVGLAPSGLEHGPVPGGVMRLYLLDNNGMTLAIEVTDVSAGRHLEEYAKVVKDFQFGT
jgi:hypothetical protein